MKKCYFEESIDDYLLGKLSSPEKEKFEEHYFNCLSCFQKMTLREEVIRVVKKKGALLLEPALAEARKVPFYEKVFSLITPKQWAWAAVSVAFALLLAFILLPNLRKTPPQFSLNGEDIVRGQSINLISPVIDISTIPSYFEWKKLGEDVEYKIYLYNHDLLWTASTRENRIDLPEEIKTKMISGEKYFWQVKAFSAQGILIAVSSKVQFKVTTTK